MLKSLGALVGENGALAVVLLSGAVAVPLAFIRAPVTRRLLVTLVPLATAVGLYWVPVWRGADPSEYSAWLLAVVPPWYGAGLLTAAVTCWAVRRLRPRRGGTDRA